MLSLRRIAELPENFAEFKEEIALGLRHLYGDEAEAEYRRVAEKRVLASILSRKVDTLAVFEGRRAAGMLMAVTKENVGHISFLHILEDFENRGVEERLVEESVGTMRAGGVEGIVRPRSSKPFEQPFGRKAEGVGVEDGELAGQEKNAHEDEDEASGPLDGGEQPLETLKKAEEPVEREGGQQEGDGHPRGIDQ